MMTSEDLLKYEDYEIGLILDSLLMISGYDYRGYSRSHIKRRLKHRLKIKGYSRLSELIPDILYNPVELNELLTELSINVSDMFRDPSFFCEIRKVVVPYLETYPYLKVWHAGCSAGQEVYSLAIVLKEENLYNKAQIYGTDFNRNILERAKAGIYPAEDIKKYTAGYQEAGGKHSFADYYSANYDSAIISPELKGNLLFSFHNLVTDGVFGEMHIILCRNVLIYFNKELQNRVLKLFYDSLIPGGFLCLGSKETIKHSDIETLFEVISEKEKIYRKKVGV